MKKVLLVYPPFCTPASPPFSLINIESFLKANYSGEVNILDLNLEFHKQKFPEYQKYFQDETNWIDYETKASQYFKESKHIYSENNKLVVNGEEPELFNELLKQITDKNPDVVAFSIVYSSQAFFALSLLKAIKSLNSSKKKITTVIGGPAINEKLIQASDKTLNNDIELLELILDKKIVESKLNFNYTANYNSVNLKNYFTPKPVIPIKTSNGCYYQQCVFCSHHKNAKYTNYSLELIKKNIIASKQKYFFLIDDMISAKRLLEFARQVKDLKIKWACQLKPTKEYNFSVLKKLKDAGLEMVMWGVESGNQRILDAMKKGTNVSDIKQVLVNVHKNKIKNIVYIMFGFPTETKEEFIDTIDFLKENSENIDLVSTSIFGLQNDTKMFSNPQKYGISSVTEEKRTVLEPKIEYETTSGLSRKEAAKMREKYKKTFERINKYPKNMNYFREHMLLK